MPVTMPDRAGQPYRPSNGTEGMLFEEMFCHHCTKNAAECSIYAAALLYELGDEGYPKEWIHDLIGCPTCTAFCDRRSKE